jgi:hypothetical protein
MPSSKNRSIWIQVVAVIAVGFGLLSIKEGGAIVFGDESARAAAGNYVPFVVWFNFLAGFTYVVAGAGLWMKQRWAEWLAIAILVATIVAFAGFGVHVYAGGAYELRTVAAMSLRLLVWTVIAGVAWRQLLHPGSRRAI